MTFLEHGLYGGGVVLKNHPDLYWWAVASGIFPDLPPLIFAMTKVGFQKGLQHFTWKALPEDVPESVYKLYDITHSFVTTLIVSILFFLIKPELTVLVVPWALHILCDIPFHDSRFSTRFLYPLSNFHIHGYSQRKHRWIHIINLVILGIIYLNILK